MPCAFAYSTPAMNNGPASRVGWFGTMFDDAIPSVVRSCDRFRVVCARADVTAAGASDAKTNQHKEPRFIQAIASPSVSGAGDSRAHSRHSSNLRHVAAGAPDARARETRVVATRRGQPVPRARPRSPDDQVGTAIAIQIAEQRHIPK